MAGQPTFRRAKRFTYLHTDYTSIFDGTETKHVKANSVASIDGDYTVTADAIAITGDTISLTGALTENTPRTVQ